MVMKRKVAGWAGAGRIRSWASLGASERASVAQKKLIRVPNQSKSGFQSRYRGPKGGDRGASQKGDNLKSEAVELLVCIPQRPHIHRRLHTDAFSLGSK